MSEKYSQRLNEDAKRDQDLDDLIDQLTEVEKLIFEEYYADFSIHYKPESTQTIRIFIKLVKSTDDGSFKENIAIDIDYDFAPLLDTISSTANLTGILTDIEKRQHELAKIYFDEIVASIDDKINGMN